MKGLEDRCGWPMVFSFVGDSCQSGGSGLSEGQDKLKLELQQANLPKEKTVVVGPVSLRKALHFVGLKDNLEE